MPNFSLGEGKHSETKLKDEYCWAITQAVMLRPITCRNVDFRRAPFVILARLAACILNSDLREIQLAPEIPGHNSC